MKALFLLITGLISVIFGFFGVGLWLYMLFLILNHIHATEMIWFVYWFYLPIMIVVNLAGQGFTKVAALKD